MHSHTLPPLHAACLQGLVTAHARGPRQRSSPTREASLGLGLTSALSGDRSVGLPSPGTSAGVEGAGLVPVASGDAREPHRRPVRWGSPGRLTRFGNRVCAGSNLTLCVVHFFGRWPSA